MTTEEKVGCRERSLLQLVTELASVSRACQVLGYSRQQFYKIRRSFQAEQAEGHMDRLPGAKGLHPNCVSEIVEQAILAFGLKHPSHRCLRVYQEPSLNGTRVGAGGMRGVWSRHRRLLTPHESLLRPEEMIAERKMELPDEQICLLQRFGTEFLERHIETRHTADPVAVDRFSVGALEGVGTEYLQSGTDCARAIPGEASTPIRSRLRPARCSTTTCWPPSRPTAQT